MVSTLSNGEA